VNRPARVLFVCIGNSCRSPMAEGFARHNHPGVIEASSAGLMPAAIIQPETYQVMNEKGVSLEGMSPSEVEQVEANQIDFVVNMSGYAMLHRLRGFEGGNIVWNIHDPIGEPLETYRNVRDLIEQLVDDLAAKLTNA
jgi:arsenate reductase